MKNLILIASFVLVSSYSDAFEHKEHSFRADPIESNAYIVEDEGNERGAYWYHLNNRTYDFIRSTAIYDDSNFPYHYMLILEEKSEYFAIGSDSSHPELKLSAWGIRKGKRSPRLWELNRAGDEWKVSNDRIIITKLGCCDSPTERYYYDLRTGTLLKSEMVLNGKIIPVPSEQINKSKHPNKAISADAKSRAAD